MMVCRFLFLYYIVYSAYSYSMYNIEISFYLPKLVQNANVLLLVHKNSRVAQSTVSYFNSISI